MLEFFYDESEHSRKLTKETLLAENFREHFVASIIGILQSEKEKVEKEYSLFEEKYNLKVVVKNKIVTEEEQIVLASILQKYVESKGNIYNDQLLGQVTDLFIDLPKEIILNKTCYFSNKATNDILNFVLKLNKHMNLMGINLR